MLTNCRECGHQVAKRAKACPNCGARSPTKSKLEANLDALASSSFKAGAGLTFGIPLLVILGIVLVAVIASIAGCWAL